MRIGALRRDWEEIEKKSLKFFFPERVICNFFCFSFEMFLK